MLFSQLDRKGINYEKGFFPLLISFHPAPDADPQAGHRANTVHFARHFFRFPFPLLLRSLLATSPERMRFLVRDRATVVNSFPFNNAEDPPTFLILVTSVAYGRGARAMVTARFAGLSDIGHECTAQEHHASAEQPLAYVTFSQEEPGPTGW